MKEEEKGKREMRRKSEDEYTRSILVNLIVEEVRNKV